MLNILKLFISLVLIIIYTGCGAKPSAQIKGNEKVFEKEDFYILLGLRAEQIQDYNTSSSLFNTLYEKTTKKEYLYRSLRDDLEAGENERAIKRINKITDKKIDDFILERIKIIALIKQDKYVEAKELGLLLVEKSGNVDDYLLVSEIYVNLKEFNTAVKYLESAYIKDYNEKILDKMSIVLYVNLQRKKDAIAQLETHSRVHGCSKIICSRLIGFYSNDDNIEGLLSTYLRMYKMDSSEEIAQKIVQIYGYKKDYPNMIDFLQKSRINDELLLQLYGQTKNYKKAAPLAFEIYNNGGDVAYLGQSAIFEYESSKDKNDKAMQKSVIKKLKDTIGVRKDGIYLNYLGYILIDHELDIKEGIKYIKEALLLEPNSIYYLDSLAWGYYKLGDCKRAKKIMDRVVTMEGSDEEDVVKHIDAINKCIKSKKGKRKE